MIDTGDIFHPATFAEGPAEASRFLHSVSDIESAGVVVRMPAAWRANRPPRPQVIATVGSQAPSAVGLDGLLDFQTGVVLDGELLTEAEVAALLAGTETLVLLRGRWVEVDRVRLERALKRFHAAEELAARDGLAFADAMRMLAGAAIVGDDPAATDTDWAQVTAGPWLAEALQELRTPNAAAADPGPALHGTLRPISEMARNTLAAPAGQPWPGGLLRPTTWASGRPSR